MHRRLIPPGTTGVGQDIPVSETHHCQRIFLPGYSGAAGISDDRMNEIQYKKTEVTKGLKKFTLHTMRRVPDDF
jgi:hypothetical protein